MKRLIVLLALPVAAHADWKDAKVLAEQQCVMCHSAEMLAQQRLVRAQWDKTTAKMASWGPELEEGGPEELAAYFAGPRSPANAPLASETMTKADLLARLAPEGKPDAGDPVEGATVFAKDCATCHGADARGKIAPSLIGRPILARPSDWTQVIKVGRRKMPGYEDRLSPKQVADMLAWVRKISKESVEPKP